MQACASAEGPAGTSLKQSEHLNGSGIPPLPPLSLSEHPTIVNIPRDTIKKLKAKDFIPVFFSSSQGFRAAPSRYIIYFQIPHDLQIQDEVFDCPKSVYRRENHYWKGRSIQAMVEGSTMSVWSGKTEPK